MFWREWLFCLYLRFMTVLSNIWGLWQFVWIRFVRACLKTIIFAFFFLIFMILRQTQNEHVCWHHRCNQKEPDSGPWQGYGSGPAVPAVVVGVVGTRVMVVRHHVVHHETPPGNHRVTTVSKTVSQQCPNGVTTVSKPTHKDGQNSGKRCLSGSQNGSEKVSQSGRFWCFLSL